jgi:two-component system OmpR family sensor kinase
VIASLRGRLIAALLGVAAIGLILLAGITYVEQRASLYATVDDQTRAAIAPVGSALSALGYGPKTGGPGDEPDGRHGPAGEQAGAPRFGLPRGTYGERRDASGKLIGSPTVIDYSGATSSAAPILPAKLTVGKLITVPGRGTDPTRYRVYTQATPGGGITIAAVPLRETDRTLQRLLAVEGLVIAGVLLLLAAIAWILVRIGLLPLDRMTHTAGRIAAGDLSHRVASADPRTEVGRLGLALNRMLDRLEQAFTERRQSEERLRRFLADASHELRTPLASIRGYAELFRMGAASEPADIAKAMRRIEDESTRMGVLVEDLLTLARLDQVADIPHTEVDLAELVRDAADDARATAPDREITADAPGSLSVRGDAHQLRQVLANLMRNALVHTPGGSPIEIGLEPGPDVVRLSVRDHGPGLPNGDSEALFERFWRSEGGRERGRSGAGLGLAIVAAIVDAHGGRVHADDAPGGGARFVVELPPR